MKTGFSYIFVLLVMLLICSCNLKAMACLSITDDYNSSNPVLHANFSVIPDINPFTECFETAIRIRSREKGWRLIANRTGPYSLYGVWNSDNSIQAKDLKLDLTFSNFGMTQPNGAVLMSPFNGKTNLSSIDTGTLILSGIVKSSKSCSPNNPNFYRLKNRICLFRDFIFDVGSYNSEISYLLIAP